MRYPMVLQAMLLVCMRLESFPATMMAVLVALLPSFVWTRLGAGDLRISSGARPRWQRNALLALLVGTIFVNAEGLRFYYLDEWPYPGAEELVEVRDFFNLQGVWGMYAPAPPVHTGWWVCVGRTRSGREIDPITGRPPTFAQPDNWGWPFGGLGSVYWFYEPDEEGEVQGEFARFLLWRDERHTPEAERLTHFLLLYVYVPYLPLEGMPHDPVPILVSRWPEGSAGGRPALREDSVLHGVELYELEYERWGDEDWVPERVVGPETY